MSEWGAIERAGAQPATIESLAAELAALGARPGMVLLVHSSLSALGWVSGGPVAVILALEEALGRGGTLVMPTRPCTWPKSAPTTPAGARRRPARQ